MNAARRRSAGSLRILTVLLAVLIPVEPSAATLTRGDLLAAVYDEILRADFDGASKLLEEACGPAPPPACQVLQATALWWRIQLDPASTALDETLRHTVDEAIKAAEAWTEAEPDRAEAWFYLGGAYAVRVQWRVLREQRLAAARDGKRIKDALERALELDPSLDDAYFGIGLYHYYADVAPAAAQILRWLLFLPGGDRERGLEEMRRAHERGALLKGEADYQLYLVYLWYERETDTALTLLERLRTRYPTNPHFWLELARVRDTYLHDIAGSLDVYRALLQATQAGQINAPGIARVEARLGLARQLDALGETDRALEYLEEVIAEAPDAPLGSLAVAYQRLGAAHDRLGQREAAVRAYQSARDAAPPSDLFDDLRDAAERGLDLRPDPRTAEAYRASLAGWRLFEGRDLTGAEAQLTRALALDPGDALASYRYGRVLKTTGRTDEALARFEQVINARPRAPRTLLGAAYLEAATLFERAGEHTRALQSYEAAAAAFGASPQTRDAARRAVERLTRGARKPNS